MYSTLGRVSSCSRYRILCDWVRRYGRLNIYGRRELVNKCTVLPSPLFYDMCSRVQKT